MNPERSSKQNPSQDAQPIAHQPALVNLFKKISSFKSESGHNHPSILSFLHPTGLSSPNHPKNQAPTDSLILDGFLKNNGGYLDDSDSSDGSDSEDQSASEANQNKHTIRVLAKKYQHETKSISHTYHPILGFNLPKKILKFHLNHSDHPHPHISTIINHPDAGQTPSDPHLSTSSADRQKPPTQLTTHERPPPKLPAGEGPQAPLVWIPDGSRQQTQDHKLKKLHRSHRRDPRSGAEGGRITGRPAGGQAWNLNTEYLQSSRFPTKYSIIQPDHLLIDHPPASVADSHPPPAKSKSPFRNLVLGQDDLLRLH